MSTANTANTASLDALLGRVAPFAARFSDAGRRLYLVGGIVRDHQLGSDLDDSADVDLTTDALPSETKQLVDGLADAIWTQGERFGTIGVSTGGQLIEITTHRAESYADDSRKPEVTFGDDIVVDLSRRDFTINAMAIDTFSVELIDPYGGAGDLAAGVLRTPLDPAVSFGDDPLRMLRAARFAAKFSLRPEPALVAAATDMGERLRIVAIERIGAELERLFGLDDPRIGLELLADTGLAEILLSWDDAPPLTEQEAHRLPAATAAASAVGAPWRTRLAIWLLATLGDVGRVSQVCATLRLSRDDDRHVVGMCRAAATLLSNASIDRPHLRRWLAETSDPEQSLIVAVAASPSPAIDAIVDALVELRSSENVDALVPLDGQRIMALLNVEPGPTIGEAIAVLRQALYDQGPLSGAEQEEILMQWWASRASS